MQKNSVMKVSREKREKQGTVSLEGNINRTLFNYIRKGECSSPGKKGKSFTERSV